MQRRLGFLAVVAAAVLAVSPLVALSIPQSARAVVAADSGDSTGLSDASHADSESDASAIATQYDHPVTVDSEMTPTVEVDAQPDGTMVMSESSVPVRVQQSDSSWAPVDTTLQKLSNDLWAPTQTVAPVRFGAGGSNVLDKVQTPDGDWITETWPYGNLPTPTVSDSTATYSGVLPGVDILLTATPTGMSDVLEIESAAAATNPDLKALLLPVSGATVTATESDTATASAPDGSAVISASPVWWDASEGSDESGPAGDAPAMPVQSTVSASGLSMAVQSTVQAATPTYPVFIDPDWSPGGSPWWYTDAAFPNQSYLNNKDASEPLAVGIGGGYQSDMFWQFSLSSVQGKVVQKAVLNTTQIWAGSCTLGAIDVHVYGPKTAGFTWNQEQSYSGAWGGILQSQNPTKGCPGQAAGSVGWTVTSGVSSYVNAAKTSIQLGVTYHDSSSYSRRHYSSTASLTITYDSRPNTPTALKLSPSPNAGCGTVTAPVQINTLNQDVTFSANVTDPESGDNTTAAFDIYTNSDGVEHWSEYANNNSSTTYTAQGTAKPLKFVAGTTFDSTTYPEGTVYKWRAIGKDSQGQLSAAWSGWCYFVTDDTKPTAPTLSWSGTPAVGSPLTVSIVPGDTGMTGFEYWWVDSTSTDLPQYPVQATFSSVPACNSTKDTARVVCSSTGSTVTVTVSPPDTTATLWVVAFDGAGNFSYTKDAATGAVTGEWPLDFGTTVVLGADLTAGHYWAISNAVTAPASTIPDSNTSSPDDLAVDSAVSWNSDDTGPGSNGSPSLSFTGGTPTAVVKSASAAVNTTSSFAVSAWVQQKASTGTQVIAAQAAGTTNPGFVLEAVNGAYQFCLQPPTGSAVCATGTAATGGTTQPNTWQMVTGVWDAAIGGLRLIVGDTLETTVGTAWTTTPTLNTDTSEGPVTVGSGTGATQWNGLISNVGVVPGVVDHDQISNLNYLTAPWL